MSHLLLALLLSQAPDISPPLTAPPTAPPGTEANPPGLEPPEVKLFADFVGRHLLTLSASNASFEVRQRERVFRLHDDDFETAFTLVPEALTLARSAHENFVISSRLQLVGLILTGAALGVTVVATLVRTLLFPLLIASLVASGVGLVFALVALPFAIAAQTKFLSALATYNHGLLELRPGARPATGGGLTLALPH